MYSLAEDNTSRSLSNGQSLTLHPFKVVLLGAPGVGKTSLMGRYMKGEYKVHRLSTTCADSMTRTACLDDSRVRLELWDTPGADWHRHLLPMYYDRCHAAVVVYDTTVRRTYNSAKAMVAELKRRCSHEIMIALAGNKVDLVDSRVVGELEVEKYVRDNGLIYAETSAKSGLNLNGLFVAMVKQLPECD
ncbi:unnamed protein product [Oppiella nova]|uniref:Uncharacterized protein n=1 Tax=Oppiella nova TaxID=334625 RepID=A0A7R9QXP5_9ACAR|nr:unnamed protein product [Oppiella nova]CAG2179440.1 unnamed protein product [Oppiella nova]